MKSFSQRMQEGQEQAAIARHTGKAWGGARDDRFAVHDPDPTLEDLLELELRRFVAGLNWLASRPPF